MKFTNAAQVLGGAFSTLARPHLGSIAMAGLGSAMVTANAVSMSNRGVDTKNTIGLGVGGALAVIGGRRLGVHKLADPYNRERVGRTINELGRRFEGAGIADESKLTQSLGSSMRKYGNSLKVSPEKAREIAFNKRVAEMNARKNPANATSTSGPLSYDERRAKTAANRAESEARVAKQKSMFPGAPSSDGLLGSFGRLGPLNSQGPSTSTKRAGLLKKEAKRRNETARRSVVKQSKSDYARAAKAKKAN